MENEFNNWFGANSGNYGGVPPKNPGEQSIIPGANSTIGLGFDAFSNTSTSFMGYFV